ncbi:MAG: M4 family metallopeptidase, partial [Saprospiraceae bacterium]
INTYLHNGNYYLLDASRSMFNAGQSSFPDNPVGGILTLNANNSTTNSLNISHVTSSNNSWNNTKAVSAHYNAGIAFTYFKNTFNRNSINGQGGSIYSIINVRESSSQDMDNAFWNGEAMFYGNGDQAFSHPLARALDVSGHEMSHGVIQSTANLTYQGESGALNESFADIFGAMIDRDDWRMGEDVVNPSVFSSGALRDMQNPHNGGSSLNTPGWQPQHYNERYTGSEDNGGVHINSGIINHAYYMVANNIGKEKAEQIFYRALRDYLTASSKFIDARNAVAQAAAAIHGTNANEVTICNNAFTSVGIGSGQGNNYQQPVQPNPGTEFLLLTESGTNNIYISNGDGSNAQQISNTPTLSRPSITDDGSTVVFVGQDKKMYIINIDWSTGNLQEDLLSEEPVWRNVSISKDGNRIAALTDNLTNQIFVADFTTQQTQTHTYTLYNPTTGQGGVTTSNVRYADVLEFDLSGQHILYDAYNELSNASYWDINVIQVWNNQTHSLTSSGPINKLFNALPDNVSIGNPTYAKNSPFIIAFDYIESGTFGESYAVLGLNLESGNIGEIYTNDDLGVPTYGKADDKVGFYSSGGGNNEFNKRNLASDKITGTGNVTNILTGVKWGTYFANGTRNLVSVNELGRGIQPLQAVPNPATDVVNVYFNADNATKGTLVLYNLLGAEVYRLTVAIAAQRNSYQLALSHLPKGTYFVKLQADNTVATAKIVKQ